MGKLPISLISHRVVSFLKPFFANTYQTILCKPTTACNEMLPTHYFLSLHIIADPRQYVYRRASEQ